MKILLMYQPSPRHLQSLRSIAPDATIAVATTEAQAKSEISNTAIVFGNRYFLQSLPYARELVWMQSNSMGIDKILARAPGLLRTITLTCARGVYADEIAEHTLALLFGISRGLHLAAEAFREKCWERWTLPTLQGSSCLILGYGSIGQAIAQRLVALGIKVTAVRRRPPTANEPVSDEVTLLDSRCWREELHRFRSVIVALPLTPETRGYVGKEDIAMMPEDGILINVSRGELVDEKALREALIAGKLLGAGLDTIEEEPPSIDNPIWNTPRLILTPHVARSLETGEPKWTSLFEDNLRRFVNQQPLRNVVNPELQY
jgi:phosphoglycerate dehydrogenase-like enzyme